MSETSPNLPEMEALRAEVERLRMELEQTASDRDHHQRLASKYLGMLTPFDMERFDPSQYVPGRDDSEFIQEMMSEMEKKVGA